MQRQRSAAAVTKILARELELAAWMAAESCHYMLWQQALAADKTAVAGRLAQSGIARLEKLHREFTTFWPQRNQATPRHCAPFLRWRLTDYRQGKLHFNPAAAERFVKHFYAAE